MMNHQTRILDGTGGKQDLYEIGEAPPLGYIPEKMHAWTIRPERLGLPQGAFRDEIVPVWDIGPQDVLVFVMAAGINYNGVWAALGYPISVLDVHQHSFHVTGSDASGIVWKVGEQVTRWKPGDEVVIHCHRFGLDDEDAHGGDSILSASQKIWGYETPDGSFAQFTRVQESQLLSKPPHLSWPEAACYMLTLATAYRMLFGHEPHIVRPNDNVLVWGGGGGLGTSLIQLCQLVGANAIAVVSSESRAEHACKWGARGTVNRTLYKCWGTMPELNTPEFHAWFAEAKRFGRAIRACLDSSKEIDIVAEHPGRDTFPVSCFLVRRGGMVVFCGSTTGFNCSFDARFVWINQKRIQGSHFANCKQARQANELVAARRIQPCLSRTYAWRELPSAHEHMSANIQEPGNSVVLVGCKG